MVRILVVDDNEDIRSTVEEVLTCEGYEVTTASNGLEGLDALHGLSCPQPDLVLLDIKMPMLDGWEFVQAKNSDRKVRTIPVIIMTGLRRDDRRCQIENTLGIMHKPFTLEGLLSFIESAVGS